MLLEVIFSIIWSPPIAVWLVKKHNEANLANKYGDVGTNQSL